MFRVACNCKSFISIWNQNGSNSGVKQISTAAFPLQFKASPLLWAEPLKKRKKIDPNILKLKEEKKKKKIVKEIKKLQKLEQNLKPIQDFEIPECLKSNISERLRTVEVPQEISEERVRLLKDWAKKKHSESLSDYLLLQRLKKAQQKALDELRLESEELYQAAVKIDPQLIPLKYSGPTETPPIENYFIPDGAYIDVSKKW